MLTPALGSNPGTVRFALAWWLRVCIVVSIAVLTANYAIAQSLTVTANPDPVQPGERILYTLTVSNLGASTLAAVTLTDVVPNNTTVARIDISSPGLCAFAQTCPAGSTLTWALGSLTPGQSRTMQYTAVVDTQNAPAAGTVIHNAASVTATGSGGSSASHDVVVANAVGVELGMVADAETLGFFVTYTLTFGNPTNSSVTGAVLRAPVPAGTTFLNATGGVGPLGGVVEWPLGTLAPHSTGVRQFKVSIASGTPQGSTISASAEVRNAVAQSLARATVATVAGTSKPIALTMTANPDPVQPGERVVYTLTVSNLGASTLTGVTLTDLVPNNTTVARLDISTPGLCAFAQICPAGTPLSWSLGSLAPGLSRTVQFSAVVDTENAPAAGTVIHNTAAVASTQLIGASAGHDIVVTSTAGPELGLADTPDPVALPGDLITYTLTFGNPGVGPTFATVLSAALPASTTFVSATGGGVLSGTVQWPLETLAPGATGQRQFTVSVNASAVARGALAAAAELRDNNSGQSFARATAVTVVGGGIKLSMTANPDPVHPGDRIVYTLTVSNLGNSTLTGVTLTDLVPNNTTVARLDISSPGLCAFAQVCPAGTTLSWALGNLAPGVSRTVQFTAVVDTENAPAVATVIHNSAAVLTNELSAANASHDVVVANVGGLVLALEDDPDPVAPGALLTYSLTFGNPGAGTVPATVLSAQLPPGTTFVGANGGGALSAGLVQWAIGPLAAGSTGQRQFTVMVNPLIQNGSTAETSAEIRDAATAQSLARATAVTVVRSNPQLALSMLANPDPVQPGDRVVYTLTVSNVGASTLANVTLTDLVPNNTTVARLDISTPGLCAFAQICPAGTALSWALGSLAPGVSRTVQFTAVVDTDNAPAPGTVIHDTASVIADGTTGANASHDILVATASGVELGVTDDPDPVAPGDTITYTLTFGNPGNNTVTAAVLTATVPSGTTFVSANGGGAVAGGAVQWSLGTLAPASTGQRQFTVTVAGGAANGSSVETSAEIRDANTAQSLARASAATVVKSNALIALSMTADPDPVQPGDRIVYSLTVSNVGASTLTGVTLTDLVPNNTTVARADIATPGLCAFAQICPAGTALTWSLGSLTPGQSRTVTFTAVVDTNNPPALGTVIHNGGAVLTTELSSANASHDVVVDAGHGPVLAIVDSPDPVAAGASLTYTITFGNPGTSSVSSADLTATLPAGATFVSANGGGTVSNGVVQWPLGTLGLGSSGQRQFTVSVDPAAANGSTVATEAELVDNSTGQSLARGTATTVVRSNKQITLSMSAAPTLVLPGDQIVYMLTVNNVGASTLTSVVLTDLVPDNTTVARIAISTPGLCPFAQTCPAGSTLSWNIGTLTPGQSVTEQFTAVVDTNNPPPLGTVMHNTASVIAANGSNAGASLDAIIADDTPDAFTFTPRLNMPLSTPAISNPVAIKGMTAPVPISVANGEYSIDGGAFTSLPGTIEPGQTVRLRVVSSPSFSTTTGATLTIGGVNGSFMVTTQSEGQATSSTSVESSLNPSTLGTSVIFTVTVTGNAPTGTVTLSDGATELCAAVPLVGGQAQCAFFDALALGVGSHEITAAYSGDSNNAGSNSTILTQVVDKANTTTAITGHTPDPSDVGEAITVTVSVTVTAPGVATPSGTITVSDGTVSCVITLPASSCNLAPTTGGPKTLTATYSGDANLNGSVSLGIGHTVNATAPVLQSAASRRVHGGAGTFSLPLSLVPTAPTVEPRQGPAQTIVFTFDQPITSATVAINEGVATGGPPTFSGNDVIVPLTGVANQQYVTVSLTNVVPAAGGTGGNASVRIGFLLGDVTQNRVVTVSDLAQVNAQLAQTVSSANFLKDVNVTGTLSVADKAVANTQVTKALPAP